MLGDWAITLHQAAWALDSLRKRVSEYGERLFETEQHAQPFDNVERVAQEMDTLAEELRQKLGGEHEAVTAFSGASTAVGEIVETLARLRAPDARKIANFQKFVDETIESTDRQRDSFDACRDRFMEAARNTPDTGEQQQ